MSKKRLVVACDGTWVDGDNGFVRDSWLPWKTSGHLATPSNVTRICRALPPRSEDGILQVVYYQAGLGSMNNWYSYFIGGYLGEGISENIREAYAFLCNNYEPGDEIVLVGFSRGAFTARSVGGLITDIGLLTKDGLSSFYPIFKDWENQTNPKYKPQYGSTAWPTSRPNFRDLSYVPKLVEGGLTKRPIPITAIGVWETVGTLGIPEMDVFGFKLFAKSHKEYCFINTEVGPNVEHAYQALGLDEERKTFSPTVWECPKPGVPTRLKLLKQCWFPGVHSSVGGGYSDTSIADITLAWMITQLSSHLTFGPKYMLRQQKQNQRFYKNHSIPIQSWAMGQIKRSDAGLLNTITGRQVRTPGNYHEMDPETGLQTKTELVNTCEFIHPSVRYRKQQKGPGLAKSDTDPGHGLYDPVALKGWEYYAPHESLPADKGHAVANEAEKWDDWGRWFVRREDGSATMIVEERIEKHSEEMELLNAWPGVAEHVLE